MYWGSKVKIVQVSGFDTLGIQVNGYLLHEYFRSLGHQSYMYVHQKFSKDEDVQEVGSGFFSRLNGLAIRIQTRLSLWTLLPAEALSLPFRRTFRRADIVHLQLIHNAQFFSILLLPLLGLVKKSGRLILSIHDMFHFTGHCIYSLDCDRWKTGCGSCPHMEVPFPIQVDTTRFTWIVKWLVFKLSRVQLVVGSPWQYRHVKMSPILRHLPVHYIPYGVDTRVFYVRDKSACRKRFGIPDDADVISFRSVPFSKNFKGTEFIIEALKLYQPKKKTYLLTLEGVGGLDAVKDKYEMVHLPWTNEDRDLIADVLSAADVFLMPSLAEAFGLMAIESMACGTPAIVFDGTALPETVNAPHCGVAVPMKDSVALNEALAMVLGDPDYRQQLRQNGLKYVQSKHTFERYANSYLKLYNKLTKS